MPTRRLLFVLTFGLAGLAVLLGLGIWQVQRLRPWVGTDVHMAVIQR